jgi:molybdopterin molybdotransferase
MKKFKDFDETLQDLYKSLVGIERTKKNVFITDALDSILATDIVANENSPAYSTSGMDGYAIRFEDQEAGVLRIADRVPAGSDTLTKVSEGICVKTFTGSLMSEGSDTLIPIENVTVKGDEIHINTPVKKGFQVRAIGENYKQGETLIEKGTKIGYAQIGVMAELGFVQVPVYTKPTVAVVSTGSEIVDMGEPKSKPAQIRSSNHVILEALCKQNGAQASRMPLVKDDKESIKKMILDALVSNDIVITTGGVSVGDFDFVKDIIHDLEPEYIVDGAFVKPGRHIRVVKIGSKFIFALPGFPYSGAVMSIVYLLPTLRAMCGQDPKIRYVQAKLLEDYQKRSKYTEFTACNLKFIDAEVCIDLEGKRLGSSAIITNLLENAALLRVERDTKFISKGEKVPVLIV